MTCLYKNVSDTYSRCNLWGAKMIKWSDRSAFWREDWGWVPDVRTGNATRRTYTIWGCHLWSGLRHRVRSSMLEYKPGLWNPLLGFQVGLIYYPWQTDQSPKSQEWEEKRGTWTSSSQSSVLQIQSHTNPNQKKLEEVISKFGMVLSKLIVIGFSFYCLLRFGWKARIWGCWCWIRPGYISWSRVHPDSQKDLDSSTLRILRVS